jgi:lipoyl(octanoyl) transferase
MIVPCGIADKQVTSLQKELGREMDLSEVKRVLISKFQKVFDCQVV